MVSEGQKEKPYTVVGDTTILRCNNFTSRTLSYRYAHISVQSTGTRLFADDVTDKN